MYHCFGFVTQISMKLFFPVDDVVKNVRHFLGSVKRATGNEKDTDSDKKSKGPKTGKFPRRSFYRDIY